MWPCPAPRRRLEALQTQRCEHNKAGGSSHANSRNQRRNVNHGVEQSSGHGQADDVEAEGPEEVDHHRAEGGLAQREERYAIAQLRANQCHICCLNGNLRADPNGNANVCLRQRWGIIDPVTNEAHVAVPGAVALQLLHTLALCQGQCLCNDIADAQLAGDALRCGHVVAGAEPNLQATVAGEVIHHPSCILPQRVAQRNCADQVRINVQENYCPALLLH
mmetsp:Transcript_39410/g.91378  ORF Transcript_39410/g.91378 Transcript_39410/m.91378 type:complete len:220 (+) Transcript_39410:435-1094(+)